MVAVKWGQPRVHRKAQGTYVITYKSNHPSYFGRRMRSKQSRLGGRLEKVRSESAQSSRVDRGRETTNRNPNIAKLPLPSVHQDEIRRPLNP